MVMRRWIGSVALAALGGVAVAQTPFTIVRPYEGERIKEKVSVRFPLNSVPRNGYVGIFFNGKLIEARRPEYRVPRDARGRRTGRPYLEYVLDAKGRGIPDTPAGQFDELKAVLFAEYGDTPRKVDESSVRIRIDRSAGITIPRRGTVLRYNFQPGQEYTYRIEMKDSVSTISESANQRGGTAAEFPQEGEVIRMLYAVDKVTPRAQNGPLALLRMQPLPQRGKDFAVLTAGSDTEPKRYFDYEMAPIYMEVTNTGIQKWGAIPVYIPFGDSSGEGNRLDLYGSFPLPTLPQKAIRIGDSWQSNFQSGVIDLEKLNEVTSVVRTYPARGEFVGVEWEGGRPCAKIRNVIEAGRRSLEASKLASQGANFLNEAKVSLNETIWFDLDARRVNKVVREQTIEIKANQSAVSGFGFGSGGGSAAPGGRGPGGYPGGPPGGYPGGGPGNRGGNRSQNEDMGDITIRQQGAGAPSAPGGRQGPGRPGGFGPGGPGGFGPGGFRGGGAPNVQESQFIRVKSLITFTLER